MMAVSVVNVNPAHASFDAEVRVFHLCGEFCDLGWRIRKRLAIVQGEERAAVVFGYACVAPCREHDAARCVVLLYRATGVGAYLNDQQISNMKFRTDAKQGNGYSVGIGVS